MKEIQTISNEEDRGMRAGETAAVIGVGKTAFYEVTKRADFPRPIQVTGKIRVWLKSEVIAWLKSRRSN